MWQQWAQTSYDTLELSDWIAKGFVSMSLAPPASTPESRSRRESQISSKTSLKVACLAILASAAIAQAGCGLMSNLIHASGVNMIPAKYEGLEDNKVAIVTVTDSSHYSDDPAARELSQRIGDVLTQKVDDIQLVREDKIQQYRDVNGWDSIDFQEIGKGVGAEKVLGLELTGLKLRDGATLYRGRCDVAIKVIDVATGTVEYAHRLDEFVYPTMAGQSTTETKESKFRKLYLTMLAEEIGRSFHPYDSIDRIALDSYIARQ